MWHIIGVIMFAALLIACAFSAVVCFIALAIFGLSFLWNALIDHITGSPNRADEDDETEQLW